ncbi:MAG: hypothetical protein DRJ26_00750 [Candidatus Methanomethylicota archaeon]|uniref:Calcineurin-like phosphoesterase domain-containing protein n=2 Tax=Thermoproteota archaeon TaxID=2056631 RepID=A0A497F9A0_9CREN|nr:MAG: hypothetical protein DRJ26_00750 [Candidatus Verstraetearchaeota archaeon]
MLKPVPDKPALLITAENGENVLVVADLHIGFELELASQGIRVPSQAEKLLTSLKQIIRDYSPSRLILLGDIKHEIAKISPSEWIDIPKFFNSLLKEKISVEVIPGNHDGNIEPLTPRAVKIHSVRGVLLKTLKNTLIGLIHGHAWPSPSLFQAETIVMGHVHPVIELRDHMGFRMVEPVWVKVKVSTEELIKDYLKYRKIKFSESSIDAFKETFGFAPRTENIIIMPAFNDYLRGAAINKFQRTSLLGPLLEAEIMHIQASEVYLLDGTFLGEIATLQRLSVNSEL